MGQQKFNSMLHRLTRLAEVYNIALVLTNQVQSNPDSTFGGNPTKVAGRNILARASTLSLLHTVLDSYNSDGLSVKYNQLSMIVS
jgi:RecA/RadA recombinase